MPKIKQQTANKIGLFNAIMVIFGAVVGIGIFFKNASVFKINNYNWTGVLVSWIVAIVMALCIAISFGELVTCKLKNKADGLGGWATAFCGHKFGRFTKLSYLLIYYTVMTLTILFFAGEACLNCFSKTAGTINFGKLTTLYVFLVGFVLFALFVLLNYLSSKAMTKFSSITGIIKFLPLLLVFVLGVAFGIKNGNSGLWTYHIWGSSEKPGNFDITNVISSIPAILFAFEGYLVIGNVAGDMKDPEKNVPLSIIIAMIIISILNMCITIGCMTAGTGNVYELMEVVFGKGTQAAQICSTIMSVLIFICIIGVLNALTFSGMRGLQAACADGSLFKGKALANKKPNSLFGGTIYILVVTGIWWIALAIPSSILNTDAIGDGSSCVLVIFFYLIYGTVLLGGFINRFTKKVKVTKTKIFPVTAVIGIIACYFVFAFSGIYQNLVTPILKPLDAYKGWGLFIKGEGVFTWKNWQIAITFWSMFAGMCISAFINDFLISKFEKTNKQALIWQKAKTIIFK